MGLANLNKDLSCILGNGNIVRLWTNNWVHVLNLKYKVTENLNID